MIKIIAEIGQNHNGDIVLAKELISAAKDNGADIAKFQVYDAKSLFSKTDNPWFDYNCSTELARDDIYELNDYCIKAGIEFGASVFNIERIKWLEDIKIKRYKVASRSVNDTQLIKSITKLNKPMIVSLGMWEGDEFPIIQTNATLDFLYCISKYPTDMVDLKFSSVDFSRYGGFSDHTIGTAAAMISLSRGAKILEKHFTLDKKMHGPDHSCSMVPSELKEINEFRDKLIESL